jgi:hypothetical protein
MTSVWLVTNGGSGEDGDEWLLDSIYATKEGAKAGRTKWFNVVEESVLRGSILTDEEREAIERAIGRELDAEWYGGPEPDRVVALRGLLERLG